MNKIVLALAALMVLSPIAALAHDAPDKTRAQTRASAPDHSVPDYYTLEVAGSGN
jgi:hypothetical protein